MFMQKILVVFPGSFNPFHKGHLNIVEKADYIFGKENVLIAFGMSPKKLETRSKETGIPITDLIASIHKRAKDLSDKLSRETVVYDVFLHEFIQQKEDEGYKVVLIRGLRNGDDLNFEENQLKYINDFKKDLHIIFIRCDEKFDHISSSGYREMEAFRTGSGAHLII